MHHIVAGVGGLGVGNSQHGVGLPSQVGPVETPLQAQRRRARGRYAEVRCAPIGHGQTLWRHCDGRRVQGACRRGSGVVRAGDITSGLETETVLVMLPPAVTWATSVIVATPPLFSAPREQVRTPLLWLQ